MNKHNIKTPLLLLLLSLGLYACSSDDVGSKEDKTNPGVTLTSLNSGEEVIGTYNITWITTDPNPSSVDIYLSTDSGATYTTIVDINVPVHDTGSYSWDSNEVADCRQCRIRIVAHDVVGNESAPADSSQDFIVNNVPQVLGSAFYSDLHADGLRDGDTIRVPFDKEINILTSIASDIFELSVLGDSIGSFAEVFVSDTNQKELLIRMNDLGSSNFHLHVGGTFNVNKLGRTASSGLNLRRDISSGVIFSPDTGRTAAVAERGIDIDPTFADSGQTLDTNNTTLLALGDINGDGHLDFVEANYGEPNKVWTNNSGVFTDSTQTLGGNNLTTSIALGDINGDGDLDMITGNSAGQANRVWTNNGSGIFSDTGQTLGGNNTNSIALGDIDNDGDLDLVSGNTSGQANKVWINNGIGSGIFSDSGQALETNNTNSIALADIDNDGDLDIVSGNFNQPNIIWINNGLGVFSDSGQILGANNTYSIKLADIDNDNDLDVVTGNRSQPNKIWINDGVGTFTDSGQTLGSNYTFSIALGDVDADGDIDMVEVINGANDKIWINDGSGNFDDFNLSLNSRLSSSAILGDVDADGDLDILVGIRNYSEANYVFLNSLKHISNIMTSSPQAFGESNPSTILLEDIDSDGDLDLLFGINNAANEIWLNNNEGKFVNSMQSLGNSRSISSVYGDVDADGDMDWVVGNSGQGNKVWLNDDAGNFTDSGQLLGANETTAIALGDIDGDGDLDMVEGNEDAQANKVWVNNGQGIFSDSGQTGLTVETNDTLAIALGDVNGDGDIDMVTGNAGQGNIIWINNGSGLFSNSGQSLGTTLTNSIILGDLDGDGDLDIFEGNIGQANKVWINNGSGIFNVSLQVFSTGSARNAKLIDIDNDNDLDLIEGNTGNNKIWINLGKGLFLETPQLLGNTTALAIGDVDGDGDIDLIEAGKLWLNDF